MKTMPEFLEMNRRMLRGEYRSKPKSAIVLEPKKYLEAVINTWVSDDGGFKVYCHHCSGEGIDIEEDVEEFVHKPYCIVLEAQALYNQLSPNEGETT